MTTLGGFLYDAQLNASGALPDRDSMRIPDLFAVLLLTGGCGALSDSERLLWPGQWRDASVDERAYAYLAWDLRLAAPCERISERALTFIDDEPVQLRSRCLAGVAANLRDASYCERVQSVSTLLRDGARYSARACREQAADPRGTMAGPQADPARLLEQLGYPGSALTEQCGHAVARSRAWQRSFSDSVARCAEREPLDACRDHAVRLAASVYFRDADAPCLRLYQIEPERLDPVARADSPGHDWSSWYRAKLHSGELRARLDRLPPLTP